MRLIRLKIASPASSPAFDGIDSPLRVAIRHRHVPHVSYCESASGRMPFPGDLRFVALGRNVSNTRFTVFDSIEALHPVSMTHLDYVPGDGVCSFLDVVEHDMLTLFCMRTPNES
jgi:hypothetical protein